ncbi:S8 family serine peptidase [Salipiger bermudensis]|uniref:S8 family serine peptidase n=1 Tax=Salipiger bermudensis TaxID=344736 RepID=UPI001C9914AD|nr:S8 family serine peptidase [Salipiger bermudensis]MBY6006698.1 S8 family serine peptidase [Salipiger bermudensis]
MIGKAFLTGLGIAAVAATTLAAETKPTSTERYLQLRQLKIDHVSRVDTARLRTINIGLDQLAEAVNRGASARTVLSGLSATETSLLGLRLDTADVAQVHERIKCLRAAVESGRDATHCRSRQGVIQTTWATRSLSAVARPAETDRTVGLLLEAARKPFVVSLYGHSVDTDIGRFFLRVAERDPRLLQPIAIDRNFQLASCLSAGFPGLVGPGAGDADARFRSMLANASGLSQTHDNVWRFTLSESDLPAMRDRAGVTVPESLEAFTEDDAFRLITADFAARFGLQGRSAESVGALRNLWTALGEARFLGVMAEALGEKALTPSRLGPALDAAGLGNDRLWTTVFSRAGAALHCSDADKVFQSYGLVYRRGDYPSANQVLRILRGAMGYPAVPGVSISQTEKAFLEAVPQNCTLFGPIEQTIGGAAADACNVRQLKVDGREQWEVVAGGANIQFFVTEEQRGELLSVLRDYAREPRDGDKLRWRSSTRVPVRTQSQVFALSSEDAPLDQELPCVVSLSRSGEFDGAEDLKGHVRNYREHFYPHGDPMPPEAMSYVFVFDEFGGHTERAFLSSMNAMINSLTESYNNAAALREPEGGEGQAGLDRLPDTALLPLCNSLADQLRAIQMHAAQQNRDISHGAFIKNLLIGSRSPLADGVGLLNPEGVFAEDQFKAQFRFWGTESNLTNVVYNIEEARDVFSITEEVNESGAPLGVGVFNLSLGQSYLNAAPRVRADAREALVHLKEQIGLWNEKGLFVVAAGQPPGATTGRELRRVSAWEAGVDDPDCPFFPACLSDRPNVITVGAVKPSATALGHKTPVLIEWANYGSAVSVAAPGAGVMAKEFGYIHGDASDSIQTLHTTSVRDGTSVATVFVTALAARMAAENPKLLASEIKARLISTAKPYISGDRSRTTFFEGDEGRIFAGVIDPEVALLNPARMHVRWIDPPEGAPEVQEFDGIVFPSEDIPFTVFTSDRQRGKWRVQCRWNEMYRIHIEDDFRQDESEPPLYKGAMVCKDPENDQNIKVAFGPLGTHRSHKQHPCLREGVCYKGVVGDRVVPIDMGNVRDIYFPVVGR